MPLTLDLPPHLEEELEQEAQKEGVSVTDHTTLLLYLITALLEEQEQTPFQNAVKSFFFHHSLDVDHLASVFEELVQQCLDLKEDEVSPVSQEVSDPHASRYIYESLRAWRNWYVHQPITLKAIDALYEGVLSPSAPTQRKIQQTGRIARKQTAMGKYAYIPGSSDDFAREKPNEIAREDRQRP
jgi:hypothetical protein